MAVTVRYLGMLAFLMIAAPIIYFFIWAGSSHSCAVEVNQSAIPEILLTGMNNIHLKKRKAAAAASIRVEEVEPYDEGSLFVTFSASSENESGRYAAVINGCGHFELSIL
jgi:hypothetical protein